MASSGTDGADGEKARPPQPSLRPEEVDNGWSDTPKPPEEAAKKPEPTAQADAGAPSPEEPPSAEPPAPTAGTPPEPDPPEPPVRAPEAVVPSERPLAQPPAEASPPAVSEPRIEPSPPLPTASAPRAAPPVWAPAEPFRKREGFASLLGEPPTKAWFFVGGVAMIASLFVGVLIGRGLGEPPERAAMASASPPRVSARSAVPAPPLSPPAEPALSAPPPAPKPSGAVVRSAPRPFNAQAAKLAIDRIVPKLKACKQAGEPPGTATVSVTFAPTGRVSNAAVTTTRYAGTRTGNCIAQRLREARVPEFTGKPMTVKRAVAVK